MRVFVVIPHYRERDEYVRQCLASVMAQTVPCQMVVVSDGPDPSPALGEFPATVLKLPEPSRDYGDTPRSIGSVYAVSRGADAIAWLDADNWYQPDHIETLLALSAESCRRTVDNASATAPLPC